MARTKQTPVQQNNSGSVNSFSNSGTWGGTGYYINFGGIKLCWGTSASGGSTLASGAAKDQTVVFPASFFSTIQSVNVSSPSASGGSFSNWMIATVRSVSTTSIEVLCTNAGSGTSGTDYQIAWFVIGT